MIKYLQAEPNVAKSRLSQTLRLAPVALIVVCTGCGSGSSTVSNPGSNTGSGGPGATTSATDITNKILTSRSANCADYAANYTASVRDVQRGITFTADLSVAQDRGSCTIVSNAIPNHDFNATGRFATQVSEQSQTYRIPSNPTRATSTTPISLEYNDGVMLNGVKVDLLTAGCFGVGDGKIGCSDMSTPYRYDAIFGGQFGTDEHNAHPQPDGTYHYHGNPHALFDELNPNVASPTIGFAADGFPIFGSYLNAGGAVRKARSSFQLKFGTRPGGPGGTYDGTYIDDYEYAAGSGDLDACNGTTVDGVYGYYVTDTYPYVVGCFTGTPDPSFRKNVGPQQQRSNLKHSSEKRK